MKKSEFTNTKCEQVPQSALWFLLMMSTLFWIYFEYVYVYILSIYTFFIFSHLLLVDRGIKTPICFLFTRADSRSPSPKYHAPSGRPHRPWELGMPNKLHRVGRYYDENSTLSKWICLTLMALLFVPAGDDSWAFLFARATASRHHTRSFVIYHARCTNRVWSLGGFDVFCCKILDLCLSVYNMYITYSYIHIYVCVYTMFRAGWAISLFVPGRTFSNLTFVNDYH